MKAKSFLFIFFILIFGLNLYAYDLSNSGLELIDSGSSGEENFIILKDSNSNNIKVKFQGELPQKWVDTIAKLNKELRTWEYMKVERMEFLASNNNLEILIIPSYFTFEGTNFLPHVPGGIIFIYDYDLRYNFRVTKDDFFLRLNDRFLDEKFLCQRIKEAVDDPVTYLKRRDPEYILRKVSELEEAQIKAEKTMEDKYDRIVNALLYFENTGFLGFGNTPVSPQIIKRVIELRKDNPDLTKEKIKQQLESENIKVKDKEIKLILNIFYNEFD
ncbi:MAG TPA: hypothetical protein PKX79_00830 [Spirochaetota bacterium]|jgi:hypothetical protein|nr:hypothetical protein [Spirochaetota bacterium]OQA97204.1 MAG: hypothetical protein BWY23_01658 [Spirochaetes bacterium ADurb.Bin218]HOK01906.1 hypothetical protein [Spirochaetota bacterium]HOK93642.1 hypothetical protein [Spirochaetota bacterium]HON16441.1 hypothetical protein [Spirochaetota bacterium]